MIFQSVALTTTFFERLRERISSSSFFSRISLSTTSRPSRISPSSATVGMIPIFFTSDPMPDGTQRASAPFSMAASAISFFHGTAFTQTSFMTSPPLIPQPFFHSGAVMNDPANGLNDLCRILVLKNISTNGDPGSSCRHRALDHV